MRLSIPLLISSGVLVLIPATILGTTIYVPTDLPNIQAAIDVAQSSDTILVAPGDYSEPLTLSGKCPKLISTSGSTVTRVVVNASTMISASGGGSDTLLIRGFEMRNAGGRGFASNGTHFVIDSCNFPQCAGAYCVGFSSASGTIRNCSFTASTDAIYADNLALVRVSRNFFKSSARAVALASGDLTMSNNTIVQCSRGVEATNSAQTNGLVLNNIFYACNEAVVGSEPLPTHDYNCYYLNGANLVGVTGELHSVTVNPQFVGPSLGDYRLGEASPCIDAGHPNPMYNDADGSRNDIGAFPRLCATLDDSLDCDLDGIANGADNCPTRPNPDQSDADTDSVGDDCDNCLTLANADQTDSDADALGDACDNCPTVANYNQEDSDGDGRGTACDNCPSDYNPSQADADGDGIGDICDACLFDAQNDSDGDGICGNVDNCPSIANANQADADGDGRGDVCDNCPTKFNPAQEETDGDGIADSCDNCPTVYNASQTDVDGDDIGNACDACLTDPLNDSDADGICHNVDNCPTVYNPDQADTNGNNIGDVCDCACQCHADPACDSVLSDILDVVSTVNVAFRNAAPNTDPGTTCPREATDVDCSGGTDVIDVVKVVNVAFRNANAATEYCEPCQ